MKITDYVDSDAVIDLGQTTADGVIVELVEAAHRIYKFDEPLDRVIGVVQARERMGTTAIGGGYAIPHAQFNDLEREVIVIGRSQEGVQFGAADGAPVQVFFLLLGRRDGSGHRDVKKHLEVLATIARICRTPGTREGILEQSTPAGVFELIDSLDV